MSEHGGSFQIVWRNADNTKRTWQAKCSCRALMVEGPTYEIVEDEWRKHVHDLVGKSPNPFGDKTGRWPL